MWAALGGQAWRGLAHGYAALVVEARDTLAAGRGKIGPTAANGWCRTLRESEEGLRRLGLLPPVAGDGHADQQPAKLTIAVLSPAEEAEIRATIEDEVEGEHADDAPELDPAPDSLISASLPAPAAFGAWLSAQAHLNGAAWLRRVVEASGGKAGRAKDDLIAEILRLTGGDPEKLRPLCDLAT